MVDATIRLRPTIGKPPRNVIVAVGASLDYYFGAVGAPMKLISVLGAPLEVMSARSARRWKLRQRVRRANES